jgi:carboxylesterase type B
MDEAVKRFTTPGIVYITPQYRLGVFGKDNGKDDL